MILLQLFGNALLLWLAYYWLGIGEANTGQLLWSTLVALAIVCAACWLHGSAFAYFGESGRKLLPAVRRALPNLLPLFAAVVMLALVYILLGRCEGWSAKPAFRIASYLTLKLRKPFRPSSVQWWFTGAIWLVKWVVLPVMCLPMLAGIASRGWAGFGDLGRRARDWRYWIAAPLLALAALWAPFQIYRWVPHAGTFGMEMTSFVLRILAGYLLAVAAWLVLVRMTSAASQRAR